MSATDPLPRFACPNWWERIQAGETPMAEVPLNEQRAAKALAFFNRLRLPDVPGRPPMKEACGDWFRDLLCAFLASEDPATKRRLVWELLCLVPKKNSKTTYVAGLGLTALFLEEAPNAQMLIIAPSQNISERCFSQAQGMIQADPQLEKVFHVQEHLKRITRRRTGTQLEVKSFDTGIVTGEIPVLTIVDELHELGKKKHAAKVMQQIRGGGITMKGGQVLFITTQSDEAPAGIWRSELKKARDIRDGKAGPSPILLPILYEFPEAQQKDDSFWRNRDHWPLVLPNLDRSIDRQRLEEDYDNNGSKSAEAEQIWVSQHLNIEIGVGLHVDRWVGADHWLPSADPEITLDVILDASDVCVAGVDGGGLDDLLGLTVIGRDARTKLWRSWSRAWAHKIVLERRQSIAARLTDLAAVGDVVICETPMQDEEELVEILQRIEARGLFPDQGAIGIDNASGNQVILDALELAGFDAEKGRIASVSQGYMLTGVCSGVARKLGNGTLRHADQELMDWCVGNAAVEPRGNASIVSKAVSGTAKIDPLMALFNAASLMFRNPTAAKRTIRIPSNYAVA